MPRTQKFTHSTWEDFNWGITIENNVLLVIMKYTACVLIIKTHEHIIIYCFVNNHMKFCGHRWFPCLLMYIYGSEMCMDNKWMIHVLVNLIRKGSKKLQLSQARKASFSASATKSIQRTLNSFFNIILKKRLLATFLYWLSCQTPIKLFILTLYL